MEANCRPLPSFKYLAPVSLDELVSLLRDKGDRVGLLAGGTDLLVWMKHAVTSPEVLVDINRIPELTGIETGGNALHIGSATPLCTIGRSKVVQETAPLLAEAIGFMACHPIRVRATLGGNLCSASPAADAAPPLLAMDASVTLLGPDGERVVPLSQFFVAPGQTVRRRDELLLKVVIPSKKGRSAFLKLGRRKGLTLAIASVAAFGVVRDKVFEEVKIALGAVAPTPIRAEKAEGMLRGKAATEQNVAAAAEMTRKEVNPITDLRASAAYRTEMAGALTKRVLRRIAMIEE